MKSIKRFALSSFFKVMSGGSSARLVRVYHEKQIAGLCGVHCLNTLLQGSAFTEVDLAEIAARLDEQEKQAMASCGTNTAEFLQFLTESSGNVAEDGNYSIQVLQEALKVWQLQCVALTSEEARRPRPGKTPAYICNLLSHWFTVRCVAGTWVNLNSLLDRPQRLSETCVHQKQTEKKGEEIVNLFYHGIAFNSFWWGKRYLELFLQTLQSRGYTIFVVFPEGPHWPAPPIDSSRGDWVALDLSVPPQNEPAIPSENEQLELAIAESLSAQESLPGVASQDDSADNDLSVDSELSQALYLSMMESSSSSLNPSAPPLSDLGTPSPHPAPEVIEISDSPANGGDGEDEDELERALRLSLAAAQPPVHELAPSAPCVAENDDELLEAIRLSMMSE